MELKNRFFDPALLASFSIMGGHRIGMGGTQASQLLSLGQPAVNRAVVRGEKLAQDMNLSLEVKRRGSHYF